MPETLIEGAIIVLIVVSVFFLAARSLYRTLRGTHPGCRCCGDKSCSARLNEIKGGAAAERFPFPKRRDTK